jgi:uncharacterized tellurite resistance protein B-like protein
LIEQILSFLGGGQGAAAASHADQLPIAVAALLVEAARMDDHFDAAERATIGRLLAERFKLDRDETQRLLESAERAVDRSTQLFRFTHRVVEELGPEERVRILEMLWEVAYADGTLSSEEDQLLRRVAGLIYVSDRERGEARQRVLRRMGHAG